MSARALVLSLILLLALGGACAVYNESCPVTQPEVWGYINVDLDVREEYVRRCEAPIGNFFADALLHHEYGLVDAGGAPIVVRVALFNGGAIRDEVRCGAAGSRLERVPEGPITDQTVFQVMPFYQDTVVVLKLTGGQLDEVLEHSVSALGASGLESQKGYFLQVSSDLNISGKTNLEVSVDCSQPAQTLTADRMDILEVGQRVSLMYGGAPVEASMEFHVATLSFLAELDKDGTPNDGFVTLQEAAAKYDTHIPVIDVVREWLGGYSAVREEPDYPAVENRYLFNANGACANECGTD